jgi:hypothetical protein
VELTLDVSFGEDCGIEDVVRGFALRGGRPSGWSWWFNPLLWDVVVEGSGGGMGDDDD